MAVTAPHAPSHDVVAAPVRRAWIDNLRVSVIVGVIAAHVSLIYALDVGWYYEERTASAVTEAVLAGIFSPGVLFGMGLLFFVAGLFTPPALERKGTARFVADRAWRLGIPTVAYLFVVDPAMNWFGDRAMGVEEGIGDYFRRTYFDDVEFGVAWFVAALLAFSVVYALWRSRRPARNDVRQPLVRRDVVAAGVFIAVASFAVRIELPFLETGELWGLNLWEYPQMGALFALGVVVAERHSLDDGLPRELRRTCGRAALVGVALAAIVGVLITLADDPDPFLGGLHPEAALIPLIEATLTLGMSLWAIDWFRRRWNSGGPVASALGRASFAAYLVHAPITIVFAAALGDVEVTAEVKFLVVTALSIALAFGLGWIATRSRTPPRVL